MLFRSAASTTSLCEDCKISLFTKHTPITPEGLDDTWDTLPKRSARSRTAKPVLQAPIRLTSQAIAQLINSAPEIEKELDKWRDTPSNDGLYTRIQDGNVWRTIEGPDGRPFFDNTFNRPNANELRIGVIMGYDG